MIFSTKIAKIGKAESISCSQISSDPILFNVFVSNEFVKLKQLGYKDKKYTLTKELKQFGHIQMLGINAQFAFARNNQYFGIVRLDNES